MLIELPTSAKNDFAYMIKSMRNLTQKFPDKTMDRITLQQFNENM